jgi:hypothetical protein
MNGLDGGIVLCNVRHGARDSAKNRKTIRAKNTARAILSPFQMKDFALAPALRLA